MMQELETHQQKENSLQRPVAPQNSAEMHSANSSRTEQLSNSNPKRSSARRSLDYSGFPVQKAAAGDTLSHGFDDSQSGVTSDSTRGGHRYNVGIVKQGMDDSVTQEADPAEAKKRVRIVTPVKTTSPSIDEEPLPNVTHDNTSNSADGHDSLTGGLRTKQVTPPSSVSGGTSSASARSKDEVPPSSAENHSRMIQYLVDELRALLGNTG